MSIALFALNIIACSIILFTGLFMAINNMSRCTDNFVRLAWICITTGAFGTLTGILYGNAQSPIGDVVLHVGMAVFAFVDRRRYRQNGTRERRWPLPG